MHTHNESAIGGPSVILLCGEVTEEVVEQFTGQLLMLDSMRKTKNITVRITSHGGCAGAGFAIHDAIKAARHDVITEAWGMAESIAALIFQAGDARVMAPRARLLLHDVITEASSTTGSRGVQAHVNEIKSLEELYFVTVAARSGIKPELVKKWCSNITGFTADQAVQARLADAVLVLKE